MNTPMDSRQSKDKKTYQISVSLVNINVPQKITNQAMLQLITIGLGTPLFLLLWAYSLNHFINAASNLGAFHSPNDQVIVDTNR